MFTKAEKGYLILTLGFLAAGSGIKAYRHAAVRLGPFAQAEARSATASVSANASDSANASSTPSDSSGLKYPMGQFDSLSGETMGLASGVNDSSSGTDVADACAPPVRVASGPPSTARNGASKSAFNGKVDLNRAEASELTRIRGIGAKTAQAIVDYRKVHGPYRDFRDLMQIKGIGEKKLEKLTPYLIL